MLHDPIYEERWKRKLTWYKAQGVSQFPVEAPSARMLVVSMDHPDGGINVPEIEQLVTLLLG